jgi:hypothetical protein
MAGTDVVRHQSCHSESPRAQHVQHKNSNKRHLSVRHLRKNGMTRLQPILTIYLATTSSQMKSALVGESTD